MKKNKTIADRENPLIKEIQTYWNLHIHDLEIARHPVGSEGFFKDLESYRFEKLHYLPKRVDFNGFKGKTVLEIGCGVGIDLLRFASSRAMVTGIDLADKSIELARKNFNFHLLNGHLKRGNGENLEFTDNSFDCVYAHGVIQYTANARAMIDEIHRVLKPGGTAIMMVYNRHSWLNFLSKTLKVKMEHTDAPVLNKYTRKEFYQLLKNFSQINMFTERFPVPSRLQKGLKAVFFNRLFVPLFNIIPKFITGKTGWHIMAFATK